MSTCKNCGHTGEDVHKRFFPGAEWFLCDDRADCRKRELENIKEEGKSNQEQKSCTTCYNPICNRSVLFKLGLKRVDPRR